MNEELNKVTEAIIGAAIAVHRELGPGLLESAYQACLVFEARDRGLAVDPQKELPVIYRGVQLINLFSAISAFSAVKFAFQPARY